MNRALQTILPFVAVAFAVAQAPAVIPPPPSDTTSITETSRVARFVAGPGDRPQGLILRNGTFVALSPGLSQRLPVTLHKGASLQITGDAVSYDGNRTVQARSITIAGIAYDDDPLSVAAGVPGVPPLGPQAPAPTPALGVGALPPPPPPPGRAGGPPHPCGIAAPPPPQTVAPPPTPGAAPPPSSPNGVAPPPPPADNTVPPPSVTPQPPPGG